ncbi:MAG TPA: YeeE/YedE family protein, partial [Acidocella sp.]|nr:YeeE/YedE family protein [Acidocella sp.]
DITGAWDPTLAFVMGGALIPMVLAWRIRLKLQRPLVAPAFDLPTAAKLDAKLLAGSTIFGIGWGIAGLCPGPAIADLALQPWPAAMFVFAMLTGMLVCRMQSRFMTRLAPPSIIQRKTT